MWRRALAVLLALVADAKPSVACSCAYEPARIWPVDGATNVPLNTRITVRLLSTQELTITLRDEGGALVPLTLPPPPVGFDPIEYTLAFATPMATLSPNTAYTITAQDKYRPDVVATFTTGSTEDHTAPAFAGVSSVAPETMTYPLNTCSSSCVSAVDGHLSRMRLDFPDLPADVVFVESRTATEGRPVVRHALPTSHSKELGFFSSGCDGGSPVLSPDGTTCVRLIAYDVVGNASGGEKEVCATAAICPPRSMYPTDSCTPSDGCSTDSGYDPYETVEPDTNMNDSGCRATNSTPWWPLAFAMTVMSWFCVPRRSARRLHR